MKYCAITYAGQAIKLTEEQYKALDKVVTSTTTKMLRFPGNKTIAIADIRYLGLKKEAPAFSSGINPGENGKLIKELPEPKGGSGTIAWLYTHGDAPDVGSKKLRLAFKKVWLEHVKRRPSIDLRIGREVVYSPEEERIISVPLDELMLEFEKQLT